MSNYEIVFHIGRKIIFWVKNVYNIPKEINQFLVLVLPPRAFFNIPKRRKKEAFHFYVIYTTS